MNKLTKIIMCLSVLIFVCTSVWAGRVNWLEYQTGMEKAKVAKKPIFLNFYANWCGYCRKMENETFSDRTVANILQDSFVPIQINSDKQPRLSANYGVRGLPFFWFLTDKAERIAALPGYIPKDMFINYLRYIDSSSYQKMDFQHFMQTGKETKTKK
jgi:thioredoxin-related protein